ncbi:MAG: transcriptional repressor [Halanaerobiaceae bacterium]|jgi:Fur family ferric uptake transcriptional regulator|nr:transcriptional repressor [Halanaerobiaceae bacterium]
MEKLEDILKNVLKGNDIRITRQREEILKILYEAERPVTAKKVYSILRKKLPYIRLSTIYRNLNLLEEKDILRKVELNMDNRESSFEFFRGEHHHHLVCISCQEIIPLECPLAEYEKRLQKETNYTIIDHKIKVYGICPECRK